MIWVCTNVKFRFYAKKSWMKRCLRVKFVSLVLFHERQRWGTSRCVPPLLRPGLVCLLVLGSAVPALFLLFCPAFFFIFSDLTAFDWFKPSTWNLSQIGDESKIKARCRRPGWCMKRCIQELNVGLGECWGRLWSVASHHFLIISSIGSQPV